MIFLNEGTLIRNNPRSYIWGWSPPPPPLDSPLFCESDNHKAYGVFLSFSIKCVTNQNISIPHFLAQSCLLQRWNKIFSLNSSKLNSEDDRDLTSFIPISSKFLCNSDKFKFVICLANFPTGQYLQSELRL